MMTEKQTRAFIRSLGPEMADRFLTAMERIFALPDHERDVIFDTFADVVDPLPEPRPLADPIKVAEGRALLAGD